MGTTHTAVWDSQNLNHSISSHRQRHDRTIPQAAQGGPQGSTASSALDNIPSYGAIGVRTALKVDLGCTVAELVYGTSLRLPGDFFPTSASLSTPDPTTYVTSLKSMMQTLHATPPRTNLCPSYVSPSLSLCSHVFIRHDAVRTPLQTPYDGPYKVCAGITYCLSHKRS